MTTLHAKIQPRSEDQKIVRAKALEEISKCLRQCISAVGRCYPTGPVDFKIGMTPLREGSLIAGLVPIVAASKNAAPDSRIDEVFEATSLLISRIESGEDIGVVHKFLDRPGIDTFQRLYEVQAKQSGGLSVDETKITVSYHESIEKLKEDDVVSTGSVSGTIEALNVHNSRSFTLYSPISGNGIKCCFRESLKSDVIKAIDRYVTVYGHMRYVGETLLPYSADIDSIEIHLPESELPNFDDVHGLFADASVGS